MLQHEHRRRRNSNLPNMVLSKCKTLFLLLLQLLFVLASGLGNHQHPHHSLHTDKLALLAFKNTIRLDPKSKLANWHESLDACNFTGVICSRLHHRVGQLNLQGAQLFGPLSPFIANLTAVKSINLADNRLHGTIPPSFSALRHLRHLLLDNNDLQGSLPTSFSLLVNLTLLTLMGNNLSGTIPPSFFSNCTLLRNVDLSNNRLFGNIPQEIGNCPNLWNLNLYNNQFTGQLPFALTNASQVLNIDIEYNLLSGELPAKIVSKLTKLQYLHLSYNNMTSHDQNTNLHPFFSALGNCTKLEELELAGMGLGGALVSSIGGIASLKNLLLQENCIFGSIPPDIGKLDRLMALNLTSNLLNGTISDKIGDMSSLEQLFLSHNWFRGPIPAAFGRCHHLGLLDLSHNMFSGEIPREIGDLVQVKYLFLNNNLLSGSIPSTLGQCTDLDKLDLSYNRLNETIPPEISGIREIRIFLNFSHNSLQGPLPVELSKLENVQEIDLSSNHLTGNIFPQISSCIALRTINFSSNNLTGTLPESLGELKNLESFDVSQNRLTGKIPASLNKTKTLNFLNLSYNNFQGKIPSGGIFNNVTHMSFLGNNHLCGKIRGMRFCSPKTRWFHSHKFLIIFTLAVSVSAFLLTICCVVSFMRIKAMISRSEEGVKDEEPEMIHNIPRITYRELSDATGGFDQQRLIGSGSFGRVYRGILPDGTIIAVKVLQVQSGNSTKSFARECQVLKRIRHRNLIRIITACSLPDFKALVLPYMANGSLESRLYSISRTGLGSSSSDLSLLQRVNICSDIAEGMAYLHHHSPVKVIHCDLKPSNVLLNDDMTALVSDFGIARLAMTVGAGSTGVVENMGNSTANMLSGSIGYIAPEYGFGSNTSIKGDVYSFGIVVLEMVTRKRPTDEMFVGGMSLQRWVKSHYQGRVERVVDSSLLRASREEPPEVKKMWEVAIGELMELGVLCAQESPASRPTMLDAADDLDRLKRYLGGDTSATFASSLGVSSSTIGDAL